MIASGVAIAHDLIAIGNQGGIRRYQLRGRNAAISNSAETVWGPGSTYARLSTAVAFEAVSDSANDAAAGTGARTITVGLIDGNYDQSEVTVTLNGATPVAITGTFLAVNYAHVATAGSGLTNAGNIDIRAVSGGAVKRRITTGATLGLGHSADFIHTIPDRHVGILSSIEFSVTGATGNVTVYLNSHDLNGVFKNEGAAKAPVVGADSAGADCCLGIGEINFQNGLYLAPRTLIELRAVASTGAGDLVASAELRVFDQDECKYAQNLSSGA